MKQLILILIVFSFAFSACGKSDDNKPATPNDSLHGVDDAQNPFKILGEVKSAKLVLYSFLDNEDDFEIEIENPKEWLELLFETKEEVSCDCPYLFEIQFTTTTGIHVVYLNYMECRLGEYKEGIPDILYSYSEYTCNKIYDLIKSVVKPDQPHHPDNLIAGYAIYLYFHYEDKEKDNESIELMRSFLNENDIEFRSRIDIERWIQKHDRK